MTCEGNCEDKIRQLNDEITDLEVENSALTEANEKLEQERDELTDENTRLKGKIEDAVHHMTVGIRDLEA